MKVRLLNSAMMPQPGLYRLHEITAQVFALKLMTAHRVGSLVSYIGYEQTAAMIRRMTGVAVELNRSETVLEDGDRMLICRLAYRVRDPGTKGEPVPEDFRFYEAFYTVNRD